MEEVDALIEEQNLIVKDMKKILINFKKISKDKVSWTTITSRRNNLQKLWEKYQENHRSLYWMTKPADRNPRVYFTEDPYPRAEVVYYEIADHLDIAFDAEQQRGKSS